MTARAQTFCIRKDGPITLAAMSEHGIRWRTIFTCNTTSGVSASDTFVKNIETNTMTRKKFVGTCRYQATFRGIKGGITSFLIQGRATRPTNGHFRTGAAEMRTQAQDAIRPTSAAAREIQNPRCGSPTISAARHRREKPPNPREHRGPARRPTAPAPAAAL